MPPMAEELTGTSERLHPAIRAILAPNPSPFTYTGTRTFIVGSGEVAVIDPGPDIPVHVEAILAATEGERIAAILCTHTHRDHSPASRALAAASGAPIIGCAALESIHEEGATDESFDPDYNPDRVLSDGEAAEGPDWRLEAVATPGHVSNHLCFALTGTGILFSGDHVMAWSTSIVSPPEGDMGDYMRSLDLLLERDGRLYYPAHGPEIADPHSRVRELIAHRRGRESQIRAALAGGPATVPALVAALYTDVDPRLHPAAERSVLAHLLDLEARGLAAKQGDLWRA
jgi:glyoxylase-like metal-dependent hydrolase (beta-lactamase superfamily II)